MSKITSALPSNRVASLATFIAGLAGLGTSLAGVWPNSTTNEIAQILGGIGALSGPLSHVIGSWLWDRTPAGQAAGNAKLVSKLVSAATDSSTGENLSHMQEAPASDTTPPDDLPIQDDPESDGPWWKGNPDIDPQPPESSIENEQFDAPTSDFGDGWDQTDDLTSSELGGPPNADFRPESSLKPEQEQEQKRIVTDSPQA